MHERKKLNTKLNYTPSQITPVGCVDRPKGIKFNFGQIHQRHCKWSANDAAETPSLEWQRSTNEVMRLKFNLS